MLKQADPKLSAVIDQLADICKPIVAHVEAMTPTTKGHYGDYMVAIERVATMSGKAERNTCLAIGLAMIRAGANKEGVHAALRVMGHL